MESSALQTWALSMGYKHHIHGGGVLAQVMESLDLPPSPSEPCVSCHLLSVFASFPALRSPDLGLQCIGSMSLGGRRDSEGKRGLWCS